ncbi:Notch signaling pathway [Batrachochytrium dendrobatidis]
MLMLMYIGPSARLMMMSLSSGFVWLLSILVAAIIAHFLPNLSSNSWQMVVMSSCIQEVSRVATFYLFKYADSVLILISSDPTTPFNRVHHSVAAGFGIGMMSGMVSFITPLFESISPGIMVCSSCPGTDIFFIGAITTSLFIFLHIMWNVVVFDGWYKGQWYQFIWVMLSHLGVSLATLWIPSNVSGGCIYSIAVQLGILAINAACIVWIVNSKLKSKQN